jgi:hypothetical protein
MFAPGSLSRRRRTAILAAALVGCLLAALAATATAAVSASGPDLATIAVAPADLLGGKVSKQGYVKATAIVLSSYEREFSPGANIGHGLTFVLVNDIDELATSVEAHRYYASNRAFLASSQGRKTLVSSLVSDFSNKKQRRTATLTFGRLQSLTAGHETFLQSMTLTTKTETKTKAKPKAKPIIIRLPFVISLTRTDRLVSGLTILGLPGGKVSAQDVGQLQRAVSARATTALTPANTAPPTVTGTAIGGQSLTGADGTWTNTPVLTRSWLRCDATGNACVTIAGATTSTYVVTSLDVGFTLRFSVSASNSAGSAAAVTSTQTAVVTAAVPPPAA